MMPTIKRNIKIGNLFDSPARLKIVTTCGIIKENGELVMGKGIAKTAVEMPDEVQPEFAKYPGIAKKLAMKIREYGTNTYEKIWKQRFWYYGFVVVHYPENSEWIGAFQTKTHFSLPSTLSLIGYSVQHLNIFLDKTVDFEKFGVAMNYPGIGLGGLDPNKVSLLLQDLNPMVDIYRLP
jgi:hypothetical protein